MKKIVLILVCALALGGFAAADDSAINVGFYTGAYLDLAGDASNPLGAFYQSTATINDILSSLRAGVNISVQYLPKDALLGVGGELGLQSMYYSYSYTDSYGYSVDNSYVYFDVPLQGKVSLNFGKVISIEALAGVMLIGNYNTIAGSTSPFHTYLYPAVGARVGLFNFIYAEAQAYLTAFDLLSGTVYNPSSATAQDIGLKIGVGVKF